MVLTSRGVLGNSSDEGSKSGSLMVLWRKNTRVDWKCEFEFDFPIWRALILAVSFYLISVKWVPAIGKRKPENRLEI